MPEAAAEDTVVVVAGAGVDISNGDYTLICSEGSPEYARRDETNRVFTIHATGDIWHLSHATEQGLDVLYKCRCRNSKSMLPPLDGWVVGGKGYGNAPSLCLQKKSKIPTEKATANEIMPIDDDTTRPLFWKLVNAEGEEFYRNLDSGESQWEVPEGFDPKVQAEWELKQAEETKISPFTWEEFDVNFFSGACEALAKQTKCIFEVIPADAACDLAQLYEELKKQSRPEVSWLEYQSEPFVFGLQLLVVTCVFKPTGGENSVSEYSVSQSIEAMPEIQSVSLRLAEETSDEFMANFFKPFENKVPSFTGELVIFERNGQIGTKIWDSSLLMNHYFCKYFDVDVESLATGAKPLAGIQVLEIGAGVGIAGLVLARLGASVVLTDNQPLVLELLEKNAKVNGVEDVTTVCHFDWNEEKCYGAEGEVLVAAAGEPAFAKHEQGSDEQWRPRYDFVVGADIIFERIDRSGDERFDQSGLIRALRFFSKPSTKIFLAYEHRVERDQQFFDQSAPYFNAKLIQKSEFDEDHQFPLIDFHLMTPNAVA
jgi:translation elongation factor EF-1beta